MVWLSDAGRPQSAAGWIGEYAGPEPRRVQDDLDAVRPGTLARPATGVPARSYATHIY